jgi:phospholipid/cholesterol/gamma-HCH transport system permease protein
LGTLVDVRRGDGSLELDLAGEWRALQLPAIDATLAAIDLTGVRSVAVSPQNLTALDLTGAWRLREFLHQLEAAGIAVRFRGAPPDQLRLVDATLGGKSAVGSNGTSTEALPPPPPKTGIGGEGPKSEAASHTLIGEELTIRGLADIGRGAVRLMRHLRQGIAFFGRVSVTAMGALTRPRRFRPISVARHVYDTGITAVPIVSLIAFLISVIIAYLSAQQLIDYGAQIFVVDLVTIGVLRELGVLLTAIIVAGRSGSAFAAELGAMQLNEEVDALYATGVDPFEALVLPRVLGLVIALPLLTVIADIIGLMGGALLCRFLLDMPLTQFVNRVNESIAPTTFWVGILKAPVFALLIALAGCYRGMQVRGSSRALGRLTTVAVVQSIFLVILADALFAILFMELDV